MKESVNASLVRIRTMDRRVVGAGFLVGERQVLTCAHAISQALGLAAVPVDLPQGEVLLDFPLIPPRMLLTAKVVLWCPPLSDGRGDIAGLELQHEPPAGTEVVRFALAEDVWEHPFRVFGFPTGYDDGVWATGRLLGRQATDWVMIEDVKEQGFGVTPGFSGTPVWDTQLQGVVGMVVAASRPTNLKAAFVLPLDVLMEAWPVIEPITRQRIFLSTAPADTAFADRLATDLAVRDIVVWNEQNTFDNSHAEQEERIRQAIRSAQAVVLVVSSQTRSSRTVKEHLRLADLYQRQLILVWIGDDDQTPALPPGWRETVWVDAHNTRYTAALEAIEASLGRRRSISALLDPSHRVAEEDPRVPRNPYKGLHAFTADDAGDFFGRGRMVDVLIQDVVGIITSEQSASKDERLLTIIGPSGSGKSSVVMAGLLPRLQRGALPGSDKWIYLEPMVPGKHPIEALGLVLKPHFPNTSLKTLREDLEDDATRGLHVLAAQVVKRRESRVVLMVDQLEELFTQTEDENERRRFIELLLTAVTEPSGPLIVLLTLRADFSDRPMHYPELGHLIERHHQPIFPMELDELRATIEQPATLSDVQLSFEGNLVGDLLFEMLGQVGALPLLQFTLEQLYERRSDHRLTLSAYLEIGGIKGALSQHAEEIYAALPTEEHRKLTRALFLRLIDPGASEQDTTRRRAALTEFSLADETTTRVIRETADAFIVARLLTTSEIAGTNTIELCHEAVVRAWKRLVDWIREAREDLHLLKVIREDAAEWRRHGYSLDRLYRGTQLAEALAWREHTLLSLDEEAFLEAGRAERARQEAVEQARHAREEELRYRATRRQRYMASMMGVLVVAIVLTLVMTGVIPGRKSPVSPALAPSSGLSTTLCPKTTSTDVFGVVGNCAFFMDSGQLDPVSPQGIADQLQVNLQHIPAPPPGKSYYLWLLADRYPTTRPDLLGPPSIKPPILLTNNLPVHNGIVHYTYYGNTEHDNLLSATSRLLIVQEAAGITPSIPPTDRSTWRYYAELPQALSPNNSFGLRGIDLIRNLLYKEDHLQVLALSGALNNWYFRNIEKISGLANEARDILQTNQPSFVREQAIRILDYLDGQAHVQSDVPRGTALLVDGPGSRLSLLDVFTSQSPVDPNLYTLMNANLNYIVQAADTTQDQRNLDTQIKVVLTNVEVSLEQVRQDAKQLVRMTDAQLSSQAAQSILNDMVIHARYAYIGRTDPRFESQRGAIWIDNYLPYLATFDVTSSVPQQL